MEVDQPATTKITAQCPRARQRHALLVDDALQNLRWLAEILLPLGFDSTSAFNISQAKKALSHFSFEVVFLDCDLPDGFGYSLAAEIRQMKLARMPAIIGMTASDDSDLMLRFISAGAEGFMQKPINIDLVRDSLRRCDLLNPDVSSKLPERQKMSFQNIHVMAAGDSDRFQFYLRQIDQQLEIEVAALVSACKEGEPNVTRTIVHRMLSLTPLVESPEFTDLLQSCQRAARRQDLSLLHKLGEAVATEYGVVRRALQDARGSHPSSQGTTLRKTA
jgi:DNA-binding response OmpR family regulator